MTENPLAKIPVITKAILDTQPLNIHAGQINHLQGLTLMAEKIGATLEIKNDVGEALVRICRNAGLRFQGEFPRGGNGSNQHSAKEQTVGPIRLADCGFNAWRANVCRKIAALPEDVFEDLILNIRLGEHLDYTEINMKNFRLAGEIEIMRMKGIDTDRPAPEPEEVKIDVELVKLVHEATCRVLMAYIPATVYYHIEESGLLQQALTEAIAAYKAKKGNGNE